MVGRASTQKRRKGRVAIRNSKRGFTLVELLVTLTLSLILMSLVGGVLLSSGNLFLRTAESDQAKLIGDNVYNWVADELTYAEELTIYEEGTTRHDWAEGAAGRSSIRIRTDLQADELYYIKEIDASGDREPYGDEINFFGTSFYQGMTLQMKVKADVDKNLLGLTVSVYEDGEQRYTVKSTIKLINMELKKQAVEGENGREVNNPIFVFTNITPIMEDQS